MLQEETEVMIQKHLKITITDFPVTQRYIYEYLKNNTTYNLDLEFIGKHFFIVGYSQSNTTLCTTIRLISTISINLKNDIKLPSDTIVGGVHINDNLMLEFKNKMARLWKFKPIDAEYVFFAINI